MAPPVPALAQQAQAAASQGLTTTGPVANAEMAQMQQQAQAPRMHDVTLVTTKKLAQAKVMGVPPEEFGIERGARSIKDCNYCFHDVVTKTKAQLIAEGYDAEQINALQPYTGLTDIETNARDTLQEHMFSGDGLNAAASPVKITEHYVRMDYEGKGRPCLYQVITGGELGDILRKDGKDCIEPFDQIPFAATTPVPMTHRFFGRSVADLVMPLQREKTAMKRGALDNLYLVVNPRVEVAEQNAGPNTLDDLLVSRPGGVVRTKTPGGLAWQQVPDVTGSVYPMLQYLDAELETKTGVSKQSQGIDANALQNQSATAVAQVFSASQMRVKLIARIMAEGVRDMFGLLHATIRKHGQEQQTVRLRNKWVDVDPRNWKTRDDMTINVGLGAGGKAQQFAQTMAIANVQKEMVAGGKANLVDDAKLYNTAAELTKIMGHKNPDRFFNDPDAKDPQTGQLLHPPVPPPPDPKVAIEQMKAKNDQDANAQKAMLEKQKADNDAQHQLIKTQAQIQLEREKAQLEKEMALIDAALKQAEDSRKAQLHEQQMQHNSIEHGHRVATMQLGNEKTSHEIQAGKEKHTHATKDHVTASHEGIMKALGDHAAMLEQERNQPVEVVRDHSGKAVGVKKGGRVMNIVRGKDGRAEKLQ
jgi:hypothetical protein